MKAIPCYIRLHLSTTEISTGEFKSVSAAKQWINECWEKPYTIVKLKKNQK